MFHTKSGLIPPVYASETVRLLAEPRTRTGHTIFSPCGIRLWSLVSYVTLMKDHFLGWSEPERREYNYFKGFFLRDDLNLEIISRIAAHAKSKIICWLYDGDLDRGMQQSVVPLHHWHGVFFSSFQFRRLPFFYITPHFVWWEDLIIRTEILNVNAITWWSCCLKKS